MSLKPRISKGTRDFNSQEIADREYVFDIIKKNFQLYGYQPIETPSFELRENLLGKYGVDADRLVFKILNSGEKLRNADLSALEDNLLTKFSNSLSEKALRYDLTVPLARYVSQNQNEITFPFKRYQIQPVWRADRPQKGRFQEFYQCDADLLGSDSLWPEIEFIKLFDSVFTDLKLGAVNLKINNRKILYSISELISINDRFSEFTSILDKIDKIGIEEVKKLILLAGISNEKFKKIEFLFLKDVPVNDKILNLKLLLSNSKIGTDGISEIEFIFNTMDQLNLETINLELDLTLARGLNYYTGTIFEAVSNSIDIGSIAAGGRYDDLTSIFGLNNISGVGISFGLDRILFLLKEQGLLPQKNEVKIEVMFTNFGNKESLFSYNAIMKLREKGIICELYPNDSKLKKQISYANKKGIPFIVLVGENELYMRKYTLKNMSNGSQKTIDLQGLISNFTKEK